MILSIIVSFIIIAVVVLTVFLDISKISKVAEYIIAPSIETAMLGWSVVAEILYKYKSIQNVNLPTIIIVSDCQNMVNCHSFSHDSGQKLASLFPLFDLIHSLPVWPQIIILVIEGSSFQYFKVS